MDELHLQDGEVELVLLPDVGARLHRLRAFGHDLLRTPDDPEDHRRDPFFWGAYVMAPWCNRIDATAVTVGRRQVAVGSNFPDGSAIHGAVHSRPWQRGADGTLRVTTGGDGWPWAYEVSLRTELATPVVRLRLSLTNLADDAMPAGLGLHPWFRRPVEVAIAADTVIPSNLAADAREEPVAGAFDLRRLGAMAEGLDATWCRPGDPAVQLRWPGAGVVAAMRVSSPSVHIVAASPSEVDAVAVEPQTHAPHGLRRLLDGRPGGLALLEPGATLELGVELILERVPAG